MALVQVVHHLPFVSISRTEFTDLDLHHLHIDDLGIGFSDDTRLWFGDELSFDQESDFSAVLKDVHTVNRVIIEKNTLKIEGESAKKDADYIHKGLASRKFTRAFHLNKYMEVDTAKMEDGILKVYLVRNVPDEEKPKHIKIS